MTKTDDAARENGWEVERMGPLAIYTKGRISILATGTPRPRQAEIKVGNSPAEPFNPKTIRAVLEAKS